MEKSGLFQIGEVAKMFHISVGTLRHYEKSGLLQPEYTDNETGYRYYSTRQFECLNTIRYLITMIDYGITDDTKKFVTEIQIPISHGEAQS